jgi:hypothetical protein
MPHDQCPPSRRGHAWREPDISDLSILGAAIDDLALRVCKRCGKLGRVNKSGVIYAVVVP